MITDCIGNASFYYGINQRLARAFEFLKEKKLPGMDPGKYEIDGSNVYALVQSYETKPTEKGAWEAHRRYIDIQCMLRGTERMGYANLERLTVCKKYTKAGDRLLLKGTGNFLLLKPKDFVVFMPRDAHLSGLAVTKPQMVKKVVVKVKIK